MLGGQQIYNAEKKLLHELEFADAGILCEARRRQDFCVAEFSELILV